MANIWEAAESGDLHSIKNYVESGGDLDLADVDGYQPLVLAAYGRQIKAVQLLLDSKADIDVQGVDGSNSLHLAAQNGDLAIAKLLVDRGINQTAVAQNNTTALWLAVQEGFGDCVKLLANPETVNIRDSSSRHVVQIAIALQNLDIVASLLKVEGIDLELQGTPKNLTALDQAVMTDNVALAELVLKAGGKVTDPPPSHADDAILFWALREEASPAMLEFLVSQVAVDATRPDGGGFTALMIAVHKRDFEAVSVLLPHSEVNAQAPDGSTCLLLAAQNGDLAMSSTLIAAKADLDLSSADGASPLFLAAQEGFVKVAENLIKHKATLDALNRDGASPLYVACQDGHEPVVSLLVSSKADPDIVFRGASTALTHAIGNNAVPIVRALCASDRIDLDIVLKNGTTPILAAVTQGLSPILKILLEAKADAARPDRNGCTPLMVAVDENSPDLVKTLLSAPTSAGIDTQDSAGCSALHVAVQQVYEDPLDRRASVEILRLLLQAKATVDCRLQVGATPLFLAVQNADKECAAILIDAKADTNLTGQKNASPLLFAAQLGDKDMTALLLHAKANPGIGLDGSGTVPLFVALRGGFHEVVRLIVESGFDVNHTTESGASALKIATVLENVDMIRYLRLHGAILEHEKLQVETSAVLKLQRLMRGSNVRTDLMRKRNIAIRIQAYVRGFRYRQALAAQRAQEADEASKVAAAIELQKISRAFLVRKQLHKVAEEQTVTSDRVTKHTIPEKLAHAGRGGASPKEAVEKRKDLSPTPSAAISSDSSEKTEESDLQIPKLCGMFEKDGLDKPSPAWIYRGPQAEKLARLAHRGTEPTPATEQGKGPKESGRNGAAVSDAHAPTPVSQMYERDEAGLASTAWKYRGPAAEAAAREAASDKKAVTVGSEAADAQRPLNTEVEAPVVTPLCRMFERPEAGTASSHWTYRGPAAEKRAKEKSSSAHEEQEVQNEEDESNSQDGLGPVEIAEADYDEGRELEQEAGSDDEGGNEDDISRRLRKQQEALAHEREKVENEAATRVQALYHRKKGIERAQNRREAIAASKVQATFRGKAARDKEKLKQKAATQVQSVWRGKVAREEYEKKMDELESAEISNMAANMLQALVKGHLEYKHYHQKLRATRFLQRNTRFHRRRRFGLDGRRMVAEARAIMKKLQPLAVISDSVQTLEFFQDEEMQDIVQTALTFQGHFESTEEYQLQMFNCAFGEVSVALQNERDTFYESFKASAAEAVKYAELTQKAAYQSIHEATKSLFDEVQGMTSEYFYNMKLTPMLSKESGMLELKEKVANVISEVNGIVTHTLSQSLDDPGFLKRAMALVLFDDFCADCTTVIYKMKDVVAMGKLVDDHIQQHMRKLRKQQIAEMEKERATRRALSTKARADPRKLQRYKRDKLKPVLAPLMASLLATMPDDIPAFVVDFLGRSKYPGVVPAPDSPAKRAYVHEKLNPLIVPVLSRIMAEQPQDVPGFITSAILEVADDLLQQKQNDQQQH